MFYGWNAYQTSVKFVCPKYSSWYPHHCFLQQSCKYQIDCSNHWFHSMCCSKKNQKQMYLSGTAGQPKYSLRLRNQDKHKWLKTGEGYTLQRDPWHGEYIVIWSFPWRYTIKKLIVLRYLIYKEHYRICNLCFQIIKYWIHRVSKQCFCINKA